MLLGLLMLGAATIMLSLGTNAYVLVVSRLFQGLSAAIIYTGGLALLMDTVGLQEIGKWMGFVLSFANAGILISPSFGGFIYGKLGAYAVFVSMGVIVVLDVVLRLGMVEKTDSRSCEVPKGEDTRRSTIDTSTENEALLSPDATSPSFALEENKAQVEGSRMPTLIFLLGKPRILATIYGVMTAYTLITSFDGVLSIFVQRTFDWGSTRAGLMFLTVTVPTLAGPLTGMLSDKYGPRWIAATGFILASVILALLPLITQNSIERIVLLCGLLTVLS